MSHSACLLKRQSKTSASRRMAFNVTALSLSCAMIALSAPSHGSQRPAVSGIALAGIVTPLPLHAPWADSTNWANFTCEGCLRDNTQSQATLQDAVNGNCDIFLRGKYIGLSANDCDDNLQDLCKDRKCYFKYVIEGKRSSTGCSGVTYEWKGASTTLSGTYKVLEELDFTTTGRTCNLPANAAGDLTGTDGSDTGTVTINKGPGCFVCST